MQHVMDMFYCPILERWYRPAYATHVTDKSSAKRFRFGLAYWLLENNRAGISGWIA